MGIGHGAEGNFSMSSFGYYRVFIEHNGFQTPMVVYAASNNQAATKALDYAIDDLPGARIMDIQGPYTSCAAFE